MKIDLRLYASMIFALLIEFLRNSPLAPGSKSKGFGENQVDSSGKK